MNSRTFGVIAVFVVALGLAFVVRQKHGPAAVEEKRAERVAAASQPAPSPQKSLPRLLDLGAGKCIPCKKMKPILEELTKEFEGRMQVEFIDVWENPAAGRQYGIQSIPTQIFYDAAGQERYRHVGFFSKADILGKWRELGITFGAGASE